MFTDIILEQGFLNFLKGTPFSSCKQNLRSPPLLILTKLKPYHINIKNLTALDRRTTAKFSKSEGFNCFLKTKRLIRDFVSDNSMLLLSACWSVLQSSLFLCVCLYSCLYQGRKAIFTHVSR